MSTISLRVTLASAAASLSVTFPALYSLTAYSSTPKASSCLMAVDSSSFSVLTLWRMALVKFFGNLIVFTVDKSYFPFPSSSIEAKYSSALMYSLILSSYWRVCSSEIDSLLHDRLIVRVLAGLCSSG